MGAEDVSQRMNCTASRARGPNNEMGSEYNFDDDGVIDT